MKTTLIQQPAFTWVGRDLFCGSVLMCRLHLIDQKDDKYVFDLQHVAFPDAVSEAGWEQWNGQPFVLKPASPAEAVETVESIFRTVFGNVLELFGGSGSTLIACEQTNRRCFAMEIDTLYCDIIVKRWEEFTGKSAIRIPYQE